MRGFLVSLVVVGLAFSLVSAAYTETVVYVPPRPVVQPAVAVVQPLVEPPPATPEPVVRRVARSSRLEAEWFSRLVVSEGGFSESEAPALLQALEDMRQGRSLLETMYVQSPHVTKRKPYTDTRQMWVSNLPARGDDAPAGWIECVSGRQPVGCSGTWTATVKGWKSFRTYARALYWSGVVPNVIDGTVLQWGGDMDYWRGVGRKFCPLASAGTKNTYWGDPQVNGDKCLPVDQEKVASSKMLTARIAAGRVARRHLLPQATLAVD